MITFSEFKKSSWKVDQSKHHKEKEKTEGGRYVETLFRVTFSNQIHLIRIADNKANSIITINTLVITLLIGLSGYGSITERLNPRTFILLPIILLTMTCLVSIIFALLATKPRIINTKKNAQTRSNGSLLFFASIQNRTLETYIADMDALTHSPDSVYHAMEIEIYNQSKVLNRKYKMLGISFLVFMYGFITVVLAFMSIFIFHF